MKNKINAILLLSCLVCFSFCKKKEVEQTPPVPMGTIGFHMHITINDTEVDSGLVMTNNLNKQKIRLDVAKLYVSEITVYKADGSALAIPGKYLLVHMGEEDYTIGEVPTGNYKRLSFYVGIDPAANASSPELYTGVLGPQKPAMWFGSVQQGYVFLSAAGAVDTTKALNGKANKKFAYQLGSNSQRVKIEIPAMEGNSALSVSSLNTPGLPAQFHLLCDFGILLQNVDPETKNAVATPFNSDSLAVKSILNQVPKIFRYE